MLVYKYAVSVKSSSWVYVDRLSGLMVEVVSYRVVCLLVQLLVKQCFGTSPSGSGAVTYSSGGCLQ